MGLILGVDPTATGSGAAVLRLDGRVVRWWVWTLVRAGWRIREGVAPEVVLVGGLDGVGFHVGGRVAIDYGSDARLVVEGLHVPPRWAKRASGADVLLLAEATGATIAGLRRAMSCGAPERPTAKEWRGPLGWARLSADAAENAAMQRARIDGWLPRGLAVAEQGAVAEAGAMADWKGTG